MPFRRRGFFGRRRGLGQIIDSIKNQVVVATGITGTIATFTVAKAKDSPVTSVDSDVKRGSHIKAIWFSINGCGLGGTGVINNCHFYLMKNEGANLTPPSVIAWGSSNEKKFIIRAWSYMIMRNQDGNTPFHWEGWIKIPKKYQRMGTDDIWQMSVASTAAVTGHFSFEAIYKWYS